MLPQAPLIKPGSGGGGPTPGSLAASVQGGQGGALPQGVTVFFQHDQVQGNAFPLFVAIANATVSQFNVLSRVANGAAHTDTYTVFKNGVATTMVLAVTNAASGSTTSNPVSLVAGDWLAIQCVTGAATAAEDVLTQLTIVNA